MRFEVDGKCFPVPAVFAAIAYPSAAHAPGCLSPWCTLSCWVGWCSCSIICWWRARDDPHTIVVSADVNKELMEIFAGSRSRPPTPEELKALQKVWLDNEVLYREGLAKGSTGATRCCAIASSSSRWA